MRDQPTPIVENSLHLENNIVSIKKRNKYKIPLIITGVVAIIIAGIVAFYTFFYNKSEISNVVLTDSEIYEKYNNATVLVKHEFGCKVKISGTTFFINVPDAPLQTIYGTGVFIENNTTIITNRHVLLPWTSDSQKESFEKTMRNVRMKIASILTTDIESNDFQSFIESNWDKGRISIGGEGEEGGEDEEGANDGGEEFVESSPQRNASDSLESAISDNDIASSIADKNYVSIDDIEVVMETVSISIAFHNSNDEWHNCSILSISEEPNVDLAKIVSEKSSTVFVSYDDIEQNDKLIVPGQKVFMLGFPLGEEFAKTDSGYKVQFYKGEVSRESDNFKIQYSIPSTQGASGAPVFNEFGKLIAINFGGIEKMENYNFGILAKYISLETGQ